MKNWWTPEDRKNFDARGACIVHQFDAFQVRPDKLHENGKLVEGESIADLGGLTIAYAALQKTLEGKPAPAPIDGFTADQRFFLGWAQVWAGNMRPEYARMIVNTDPHPLDSYRVNAPVSNMPAFSKAFDCGADSKMVRPGRGTRAEFGDLSRWRSQRLLRNDGGRFIGRSGNQDGALMLPVPDAFARALPQAARLPDNDQELRQQERSENRFGTQMRHPDVQAYSENDPGDQTHPQI